MMRTYEVARRALHTHMTTWCDDVLFPISNTRQMFAFDAPVKLLHYELPCMKTRFVVASVAHQ